MKKSVSSSRAHVQLLLLLAMAIWGSSFVAMKIVVASVDPMIAVFIRMLLAVLVFLCVVPWVFKGFCYRKGDWKALLAMAVFEPCIYFIFESQALQFTSASQAGMITSLLPIMIAVSAFFIFKERLVLRQWLGLLLAMVGVVWMTMVADTDDHAPNPLLGNLLEFGAMAAALGYTLLIKYLCEYYSVLFLTALQAVVGTLFFAPLAFMASWPEQVAPNTWMLLLYLGVGASIGAYGLYNYALSRVDATVTAGYVNLIPAFAVLFSVVFLGEVLSTAQWLAIIVIFIGVYMGRTTGLQESDGEYSKRVQSV